MKVFIVSSNILKNFWKKKNSFDFSNFSFLFLKNSCTLWVHDSEEYWVQASLVLQTMEERCNSTQGKKNPPQWRILKTRIWLWCREVYCCCCWWSYQISCFLFFLLDANRIIRRTSAAMPPTINHGIKVNFAWRVNVLMSWLLLNSVFAL